MANKLIPEELNALIQEYLTDGVLTDKERAVILKKAEGMGLDRDEIDLYLDAQVQKIDQATDAAVRRQKGKTCPYCGGSVPQLTDKCPHCGENITAEASEELQEIFENLEGALVDLKAGKDVAKSKATVERYTRKAKMFYGSNPKIQTLLENIETEMINAEKNVVNRNRIDSLKKNYKKIGCASLIAIILFASVIESIRQCVSPNVGNNVEICSDSIRHYLANGNPDKAALLFKQFKDPKLLGQVYTDIEQAYVEKGEYDKAIGFREREGYDEEHSYRLICLCIDKMKNDRSKDEIKAFIIRNLSILPSYKEDEYREKLFDYAGI